MDESPTKPNQKSGFIVSKSKTKDSANKHYQIARPQFKTGVWKFINFFIRHKNHKRITSQKAKLSLSPVLFNGNRDFLEDNRLRNDYGLCLLSEELGDQSKPFDKELLMENEKVEGETHSGEDGQKKGDSKKFFHKMNLEGLMKLFADLHRKKRARELTKSNPSMSEEIQNPMPLSQPSTLGTETVEKDNEISSPMTLKQETTITEDSSTKVVDRSYINSTNMATPANSPQVPLKDNDANEQEDGTLNLLECVRTKLTDYLNTEESVQERVNSLRATYNDTAQCNELADDYWSRRVVTTLDNDSLKYDSSCDDISSLRNNSLHVLSDDVNPQFSKDSIYSRQSFKGNNFDLNQSFLEETINSELIPPIASPSSRRTIAYQLLLSTPFNDPTRDQEEFPKMLSCHELNLPPDLQDRSSTEIVSNKNEIIENAKDEDSDYLKSTDVTLTQTCDRGVDALQEKTSSLCNTGVGSTLALIDDETKSSPTIEIFSEDLMNLEDETSALQACINDYINLVAVPTGSQDIINEEEPYLVSDTIEETSIDEDLQNLNDEELIYSTEIEEVKSEPKMQETKATELLFVSKYMNNENEINNENEMKNKDEIDELNNEEIKDNEETVIESKSQECFEAGSQTNDVIVLDKDEMTSLTKKIELEAVIRNEITNNFNLAMDNKNLVMVTAEDQLRTDELEIISNDSNLTNNVKHNTTEENIPGTTNVHLTDSITSDLLSNLDLIVLTRKDDVGNAGSDSGIYMSKNASRITTLTYRESQTINQTIDDKPSKIEGEITNLTRKESNVDDEKKNDELKIDDPTKIEEEKEFELDYDIETQMNQEAILESLKENYAPQTSNPEMVYAQAEADIKTMIKELLRETEDIKESIIATKLRSKSSSVEICKEIVEDMVDNLVKEDIPMEADMKNVNEKETNQDRNETIQDILDTIIEKVYTTADAKVEENAVSVNYCLVRNNFHDKSKKHDSRVVRANKLFRAFYKIKRNFNKYIGPKVTVINLSPTSQIFLRSDEKLTNRIRRSAALLMALYEEMRDYSYYSCTSNILCDLYESMSKNERYLNHQKIPRGSNFIANVNNNVFLNYPTITDVDVKIETTSKEKPQTSKAQHFDEPNCSTSNEESSSTISQSFKNLPVSTSNSSIYSDDEENPFCGILPNLRYTYRSQEEINTDEEMIIIDNNIAVNAGRDLGLDVPLTESLSNDSIHTDIAINDSENFIIFKDLSMA